MRKINDVPATPTASQQDRAVSLKQEVMERGKQLEDTKAKDVREIMEALEALPLINVRVKSIKP